MVNVSISSTPRSRTWPVADVASSAELLHIEELQMQFMD